MTDDRVTFSIVVAVLNGEKTLQRCLNSVIGQTYAGKELIVIDGGSTDSTVDIIKKNQRYIAYWESRRDSGIYNAWNKGLKHAHGSWTHFLGADDYYWAPDVLTRVAAEIEEKKPVERVLYGQAAIVNGNGNVLFTEGEQEWDNLKDRFLQVMTIPHPGTFHHIELFKKHGCFDEDYIIAGDYEFLLRELKDNRALRLDELMIAAMQHGGISKQKKFFLRNYKELSKARKKNRIKVFPHRWLWGYCKALSFIFLTSLIGEKSANSIADFYRVKTGRERYWTR